MGVRLLGRAMLGKLVVVAINYDLVRTVKSYDLTVLTRTLMHINFFGIHLVLCNLYLTRFESDKGVFI